MIKNWKRLDHHDLKHLKESNGIRSTEAFLKNYAGQKSGHFTCYDCEAIARKTGLNKVHEEREKKRAEQAHRDILAKDATDHLDPHITR